MPRLTINDNTIQIPAAAKLNLGLRVFAPRPDGFHNIESLFVPLAWHDTLTISPAGNLQFTVSGRTEGIPTEHDKNLITKAALLLAQHADIKPHAEIHLHKILPPGGGLGGGSSDAASALIALNHLWNLHLPTSTLQQLAGQLGSDVPFFITGTPALCTGRGEIVTPLPLTHNLFAVLIIPPQGCPTKEVFQAFDAMLPTTPPAKIDWQKLATLPADQLSHQIQNDLARPAYKIAPWLNQLQRQAQQSANQPIHLTGSGSTLFTLTHSALQASTIQQTLTRALDKSITIIPTQIQP